MISIKEYLKCKLRLRGQIPIHDWQVLDDSNWLRTVWVCPDCRRKRKGIQASGYFSHMPTNKVEQLKYLKGKWKR